MCPGRSSVFELLAVTGQEGHRSGFELGVYFGNEVLQGAYEGSLFRCQQAMIGVWRLPTPKRSALIPASSPSHLHTLLMPIHRRGCKILKHTVFLWFVRIFFSLLWPWTSEGLLLTCTEPWSSLESLRSRSGPGAQNPVGERIYLRCRSFLS